ncbi:hypothetical protein GALMADRAFT_230924 [Galerina marginata CBS 339.88]|uniref:C2H2-type domain-containing protein n=1 Tax=Galerina marginata (strain CBS 339.88) TaxID=685588 RepID=A0A067SDX5_GALM3|nr:hypothetical protein GALMADRAFT_230924 [Galerina marginata CBS 339.88]
MHIQTIFKLFFLAVFFVMLFSCPENGCSLSFPSTRGLNQHRQQCPFAQDEAVPLSSADALARLNEKRARKRRRLNPPEPPDLPEETAGPSGLGNETDLSAEPLPDTIFYAPPDPVSPTPSPPPRAEPELSAAGRIVRKKRLTWKLLQRLPEAVATIPEVVLDPPSAPEPDTTPHYVWKAVHTLKNSFGMFREYPSVPTHNPDDLLTLENLSDITPPHVATDTPAAANSRLSTVLEDSNATAQSTATTPSYFPFANSTIFGLMNWMWSGSAMKSIGEMVTLVNFLKSDEFKKEDLVDFDIRKETAKFDASLEDSSKSFGLGNTSTDGSSTVKDGWREVEVDVQVPPGRPCVSDKDIPIFLVPGLHYRSLIEVIKAALEDPASKCFHYTPFKQFWKPTPESEPIRVYDEIYASDAMVEAHEAIQNLPAEPGCTLERVIIALMFWSDSTHLASFGNASLWPIYLFFGNQSKWLRGKPRTGSCHHLAYIPKLPDSFHDFYTNLTGGGPSQDTLTHLRRELIHAIWKLLLDDEFMHAYEHGIVIMCPDGVLRRFYPRIFTYSADYPEKVLLAAIRNLGACPCPRCLIPKERIPELGTVNDQKRRETLERLVNGEVEFDVLLARDQIYRKGKGVKSAGVERILAPKSLVPTHNAFSALSKFGLNLYKMLVVDFMHEWELGAWKATFVHLIRILVAHGETAVQELNRRYRAVPTFGRSTIRRFGENASSMKKLAARNYEDLLQCAIPVFEGLLPEPHNDTILSLLFTMGEWHTLGKLRMHTETSLNWFEQCTTDLGRRLRKFKTHTCSAFKTKELPKEEAARGRRRAKKKTAPQTTPTPSSGRTPAASRKAKIFNMITYKLHSLGDYVKMIRWFGTSDSYSTQPGELEHRRVKRFYARTNKNNAVRQMTRLERREFGLRRLIRKQAREEARKDPSKFTSQHQKATPTAPKKTITPHIDFAESEALPFTPPDLHHHISHSRNFPFNISSFLSSNVGDPAIEDFYPKLQEHLLARLHHPTWTGDGSEFSDEERSKLAILNNRLFRHKVMRINYTTYDVRRGQDSINSRNHADIMVLARGDESGHPFEYARVIGIFHLDAVYNKDGASDVSETYDVLWVRWYRRDTSYRAGFERKRLHRIEFVPSDDPGAFGFLNPDEVIRAAHLIPAFYHGATESLLKGLSVARGEGEIDDWRYFYVNLFVDRDMYMRYAGNGIGHYKVDLADDARAAVPSTDPNDTEGDAWEDVVPQESVGNRLSQGAGEGTEGGAEQEEEDDEGDDGEDEDGDEDEDENRDSDEGDDEGDDEGEDDEGEDDDLGAEDGEGGFVDLEDDEGYAPL